MKERERPQEGQDTNPERQDPGASDAPQEPQPARQETAGPPPDSIPGDEAQVPTPKD